MLFATCRVAKSHVVEAPDSSVRNKADSGQSSKVVHTDIHSNVADLLGLSATAYPDPESELCALLRWNGSTTILDPAETLNQTPRLTFLRTLSHTRSSFVAC